MKIGSNQWKQLIIDCAEEINVTVSASQVDQFAAHATELEKWSRRTNLTNIFDPIEVAIKHFVDSIIPAPILSSVHRLADIGSGGGFPGIPLKIMLPSLSVSLLDSSRKKTNFQKHIIRRLDLDDIDVRQVRVEDFALEPENLQAFDAVICRAFSDLQSFVEKAFPLLSDSGKIIALKGNISSNELNSVQAMTCQQSHESPEKVGRRFSTEVIRFKLPRIGDERSMIILEPISKTI